MHTLIVVLTYLVALALIVALAIAVGAFIAAGVGNDCTNCGCPDGQCTHFYCSECGGRNPALRNGAR